MIFLLLAGCLASTAPARAADPTPTAQPNGGQTGAPFPIAGLFVLLAPAIWMVYQSSRKGKADKVTAVSCLPVIDESRPLEKR